MLLSHLHHDHAELRSLRMLPSDIPIITASQNAGWLRRRKLRGVAPSNGDWLEVGGDRGPSVSLCEAQHSARPMPHRPNQANGHLVRSDSFRVWIAGDTSLFDGLGEIAERAGGPIDLAIVPVSGWAPRLSAGHLGPVEAAEACARVGALSAMPVHWGTLHIPGGRIYPRHWMDRPGPEFVSALAELAPGCRPVVLSIGVRTRLTSPAR